MDDIFETEFQVTPNTLVKGVTWGLGLLFLCIIIFIPLATYLYEDEVEFLWLYLLILFTLIFASTYIGAWAYSPQTYFVSDKTIRIQRPVKSISIPVNKLTRIEPIKINVFKTIRKWGNGGLFSITGLFYTKEHGDFWVYAKNNNYIMLYADKKYVLSPDDKELFMQTVKSKIERNKKY
jgi:hypothetical protein